MAAQPVIAPAGSSSYASGTMHIGDGTWVATTDTFLLPNVQGLNFATMRYNGMGNRFRALDGYTSLVTAHGILAAITFLIIVPAAILTASFYHRNARLALRVHIGLQVLTVLLTTVIFVLGYFQVGPERSLTNPHHGIGLAIFLMVLVQAFGGWLIKKIEKGKVRYYIPIKLMLHQWFGRGIALLGFAQVPIGLTLYGSPASLFIVYTLWMTFLLILYFVLVHKNHKRVAMGYHDDGTDTSISRTDLSSRRGGPDHHRLEQAAAAVGLGAAVAALRRRSSGRRDRYVDESQVTSTHPSSHGPTDSRMSEKFTESSDLSFRTKQHTWRNRFLGGAAGAGGIAAARSLFNRRRTKSDTYLNSESGTYARPPLGRPVDQSNLYPNNPSRMQMHQNQVQPQPDPYVTHMAAVEEGRPVNQTDHWQQVEERERLQQNAMSRGGNGVNRGHVGDNDMQSRLSESSYSSLSAEKEGGRRGRFGLPASLGAIAGLGGISSYFQRRRERKEDERIENERRREQESESLYMDPNGQPRYTGDGTPRRVNGTRIDNTGSPSRNTNRQSRPYGPGATQIQGQSVAGADPNHQQATDTRFAAGRDPNASSPSVLPVHAAYPPPANVPPVPGQTQTQSTTVNNNPMMPPLPTHSSPPSTHTSHSHSRSRSGRRHRHGHHRQTSSNTNSPQASTTFPPHQPHIIDPHTPLSQNAATTAASTSLLSPPAPPFAQNAHSRSRNRSRSAHSRHDHSTRPNTASSRGADDSSPHTDMNSPPVSVKVTTHNNGRHVTLRRLSEEEAAREREARRRGAGAGPSGTNSGYRRDATPVAGARPDTAAAVPVTGAGTGMGSSPGAYDTGTGATSEMTDFGENRRRRRAERAREAEEAAAAAARARTQGVAGAQGVGGAPGAGARPGGRRRTGGGTGHVEFT